MDRRQVLRIAGGGVIAAAAAGTLPGCSADLPAAALSAWTPPANTLDLRRWVISHALLAPHAHNLQSWLVDLGTPDTIVLRIDKSRLLPETDPYLRQIVISQGTFIEVLDLAARQRGYRTDVALFPEGTLDLAGAKASATARIRLIRDETVQPDPLFQQVFHRRTNRGVYEVRVPSDDALKSMAATVAGMPVQFAWVTSANAQAMTGHQKIATDAWRTELVTPRTLLESYHLLRIGPKEIEQYRDGISLNSPMVRALTALGLFDRTKASAADSSEIQEQIDRFNKAIASTPAYIWFSTPNNERSTQLMAGRAYVRLQLAATANGLSMHPLSQALQEYPEQTANFKAIHQLVGATAQGHTVQMWTRLGFGSTVQPSPRRGLAAHVEQV